VGTGGEGRERVGIGGTGKGVSGAEELQSTAYRQGAGTLRSLAPPAIRGREWGRGDDGWFAFAFFSIFLFSVSEGARRWHISRPCAITYLSTQIPVMHHKYVCYCNLK
jgi:hypothetical protein